MLSLPAAGGRQTGAKCSYSACQTGPAVSYLITATGACRSVATRKRPLIETPAPPPMVIPSGSAPPQVEGSECNNVSHCRSHERLVPHRRSAWKEGEVANRAALKPTGHSSSSLAGKAGNFVHSLTAIHRFPLFQRWVLVR
jgi:hypothetical protein